MKHQVRFCLAIAVATLPTAARAGEVEIPLPTVQIESPEASPRPFGIGVGLGSTLSASISTADGDADGFGSSGNSGIRLEFAPGERLVLGVVAATQDSENAAADYLAGRIKLVLRSAAATPGAWDVAIAVGRSSSSSESFTESGNVDVTSNLKGSTTSGTLIFGRHVGDGRTVLFGGALYTSAGYSGQIVRTTETRGSYVEGGCFFFFLCWGGHWETIRHTETTQVSGEARAMGLALGAARRWDRVRLAAQLAVAQVDDGAGGDTVGLFTASGDLYFGRHRNSDG